MQISTFSASVLGLCLCAPLTMHSAGSTHCPPDTNNDQIVNANDLLAVVSRWGSCAAPCTADIVPSGVVDTNDLLAVLGAWGACPPPPTGLQAVSLWCENFELGNFARWTGAYGDSNPCTTHNFATDRYKSPTKSHRSAVTCTAADSHRGYAGLRFNGDVVLPDYTTSLGGIDAPHGVIVSFNSWLDCPYAFSPTQWLSLMTVTDNTTNAWTGVVTLNLDDATGRLKPVHVSTVTYAPNAPAFPRQQWVKTTVYLNYYTGQMHVWQNGAKVVSATFSRPTNKPCQWHFGLYASGNNNNVVLYEDDISIVKLTQPLTNFTTAPNLAGVPNLCAFTP